MEKCCLIAPLAYHCRVRLSERSDIPKRDNPLHTAQLAALQGTTPCHDLTLSNPTRAALDYGHYRPSDTAAADLLGNWRPSGPEGPSGPDYTVEALGLRNARLAIAKHWHEPLRKPNPEHLVLMPSSSEAYHRLFTLLCDPGDEILAPEPSYPLFSQLAQFANVRLVPYSLNYDGAWHIDFESIDRARSDRTAAIVAVSPNNPTGCYTGNEQLQRLAQLHLPLISDEVFARYRLDAPASISRSAHAATNALTFCIDGLSKSAGLPHVKCSWLSVSGPPALRDECLRRLGWLGDTYLSTATPVQQQLPQLLKQSEDFRTPLLLRLKLNLTQLRDTLRGSAASVLRTEGGWYAMVRLPSVASDEQWAEYFLDQAQLLVHPGYYYDLNGPPHCVVSLLSPPKLFALAVAKLRATVDQFLQTTN